MKRDKHGGLADIARTILFAVLIAFGIRTFAFEPFNIPSGSMEPTLLVGDYLFVSKYAYGYSRHSTFLGIAPFDGRVLGGEPERGDVVVFKLPRDPSQDYIKRVIGLPGDRVQVIQGLLHINGTPVRREPVPAGDAERSGGFTVHRTYLETLPNGRQHFIREIGDNHIGDNTREFTVPAGHLFMMGDNRDNSEDSRALPPSGSNVSPVGFVPIENLVGRAEVIFLSLDDGTRFLELWRWPESLRIGRLFEQVE